MVGIILAAGVGSRLRPLTKNKPKCLVKTSGKAILQYQLDAYIYAGIKDIYIIVGYEGDTIKNYCKHIKELNITFIQNIDYETTNNMYSLYLAKKHVIGKSFILNNADISIDREIIKLLVESEEKDAIAIDSSIYNNESMKVSTNNRGIINDISKVINSENSKGCSIDIYKFSKKSNKIFFQEIEKIIEIEKNLKDWTEVAMQRLFNEQKLKFKCFDISGYKWVEIDNYEDLAISDKVFSSVDNLLGSVEHFFFDLDGTIYVGPNLVEGAIETLQLLRSKNKKIYFLSNNSSKSKLEYVEKLNKLGIECNEQEIILSTDAVIEFLKSKKVVRVHILGTNSLKKIFLENNFEIDSYCPEYVVVGYDTELNYQKLISACKFINEGVDLLATHCDNFCPSEHGPIPDIGALIEMLYITTGKRPAKTFGKPYKDMLVDFLHSNNINVEHCMVIGDRLHTDIFMAKQLGMKSIVVLSGETNREMLENSNIQPDAALPNIGNMFNFQ